MRQELELLLREHLRSFRYRDMGAVASAASGLAVRWSLVSWIYRGAAVCRPWWPPVESNAIPGTSAAWPKAYDGTWTRQRWLSAAPLPSWKENRKLWTPWPPRLPFAGREAECRPVRQWGPWKGWCP